MPWTTWSGFTNGLRAGSRWARRLSRSRRRNAASADLVRLARDESDGPLYGFARLHQGADCAQDLDNRLVVTRQALVDTSLQRGKLPCKFVVGCNKVSQANERPHDLNVDRDRSRRFQDRREHRYPLFGEGIGRVAPAASAGV